MAIFLSNSKNSGSIEIVSNKIVEWNSSGNVGAVVGATSIAELESIASFFARQKNPPLLLIPGVGSQGGSASEVMVALRKNKYPLTRVLINSSSAVLYAHEKNSGVSFEKAAVDALKELHVQTRI